MFQKAVQLAPDNGALHFQIGRILQVQGNVEEALRSYEEAVRTQPDLIEARKAIADILLEQQNDLMALVSHRQLIELAPDDASSYYHLGLILQRRGRTAEAIEALKKALELYQQQNNTVEIQRIEAVLGELQGSR